MFDNFSHNLRQKIGRNLQKNVLFKSRVIRDLHLAENENSSLFKQRGETIYQQILCLVIAKQSLVPNVVLKNPKTFKNNNNNNSSKNPGYLSK